MGKEKRQYIYTMEYYSARKKDKIKPFAATWMKLELLILSEISQKKKDKYHDITYIWNLLCSSDETTYGKETNSWTWRTDS